MIGHNDSLAQEHIQSHASSFLVNVLNDPSISRGILNKQLESIVTNKENTGLICNGKFFPLSGKFKKNKTITIVTKSEMERACSNDRNRVWFHSHGTFTKRPSLVDERTNAMLFSEFPAIQYSCIAGSDGVLCNGRDKKRMEFTWGDPFYAIVNAEKNAKVIRADKIFCDKNKGNKYLCEGQIEGGNARVLGTFNSIVNDGITKMEGKELAIFTDTKNKIVECLASKSTDGEKSLSCVTIDRSRSRNKNVLY